MRRRMLAIGFYRNSRCSRWPWRGLRCRRRSRSWRCLRAQEWTARGRATGPQRPWCSSESLVISYVKKSYLRSLIEVPLVSYWCWHKKSHINLKQRQIALRHLRTKVEIPLTKNGVPLNDLKRALESSFGDRSTWVEAKGLKINLRVNYMLKGKVTRVNITIEEKSGQFLK